MINRVRRFLTSSVLWRLLLGFLVVTIPLYAVGITVLYTSSDFVTQKVQKSIQEKMHFFIGYLDKELQNVSQMLVALNNDSDLALYILHQNEEISFEKVDLEKSILTKMNMIYYSNSYMKDVFLILPRSGMSISILNGSSRIGPDEEKIIARIKKSETQLERFADSEGLTYTIVFPDVYRVNNNVDYILGVKIDQNRILDDLKLLQNDAGLNVFLMENENKQMVGSRNLTPLDKSIYNSVITNDSTKPISTVKIGSEKYLVQMDSSLDGVFSLVSYVREDDVLAPVLVFRRLLWLFVGCSLVLMAFMSLMIFRQIHRPLKSLVHYMREVEKGNLNINFNIKQGDEFGYVYNQFYKMVGQLRTLIEEVLEKKIQLQRSKLKQLQSQINPHFLFNCFYIGYRMAKEGENENVANLCKYLGDYFRFITKQEKENITLYDELMFTSTYLEIQKIRFPEKLHFSITRDDGVDTAMIPGLTIQPLVENSILHGIDGIEAPGYIEIKVQRKDSKIIVEVLDNGIGMTGNSLEELKSRLNSGNSDSNNCGLWNVHWRLRQNYEKEDGLSIENREEGGLKVSFSIPLQIPGQ